MDRPLLQTALRVLTRFSDGLELSAEDLRVLSAALSNPNLATDDLCCEIIRRVLAEASPTTLTAG